jgi:hypothetical protein
MSENGQFPTRHRVENTGMEMASYFGEGKYLMPMSKA